MGTKTFIRVCYTTLNSGNFDESVNLGTRGGRMGHFTRKGGFILEPRRQREFVVPDLSNFEVCF